MPPKQTRVWRSHKDGGFVTLLLQDKQAGLQVDYGDTWIDVPPIPGIFVINVGEVLELASNGYLRVSVHRVVTPPAGTDRILVPLAGFLRQDANQSCAWLVAPEHLAALRWAWRHGNRDPRRYTRVAAPQISQTLNDRATGADPPHLSCAQSLVLAAHSDAGGWPVL